MASHSKPSHRSPCLIERRPHLAGERSFSPNSLEGWTAERRPALKTVYEWQRVIKQLVSFLGHESAHALTADDLLRWKLSMVDAGLRPKTVRDAKLAPVRAILQWGVQNQLLAENVAEKVTIDVRAKQGEKSGVSRTTKAELFCGPHFWRKIQFAGGYPGLVLTLELAFQKSVSFGVKMLSR